jgi:hypothetical protein
MLADRGGGNSPAVARIVDLSGRIADAFAERLSVFEGIG